VRQWRAWTLRLAGVLPGNRRELELADEIEGHLQMHIDDNVRAGMTPEQAPREAVLKLGAWKQRKKRVATRAPCHFSTTCGKTRASRSGNYENPGFPCKAVLVLAIDICPSASLFRLVDAALIKPLPYRNPSRLAGVFSSTPLFPRASVSYPNYLDWKNFNKVFRSFNGRLCGYGSYVHRPRRRTARKRRAGHRRFLPHAWDRACPWPRFLCGRGFALRAAWLHRSSAWLMGSIAVLVLLLGTADFTEWLHIRSAGELAKIGVRKALGAQRASVYSLVLKEAGWLIAVGIVLGTGCSLAAGILIRGLLFGVASWDMPTLAAVAALPAFPRSSPASFPGAGPPRSIRQMLYAPNTDISRA
jgi:hypothetical protein